MELCVALDVDSSYAARHLIQQLSPYTDYFKVGLRLFVNEGPEVFGWILDSGAKIFLDLKFYDIPSVIYEAAFNAACHQVSVLTVHALGGKEMMMKAVKAAEDVYNVQDDQKETMKVFAVTVLTSTKQGEVTVNAMTLSEIAYDAGVHGVVAPGKDCDNIKRRFGPYFSVVIPGIRLFDGSDIENDDQYRTCLPEQAKKAGSDMIVVGRPIIHAEDPIKVIQEIRRRIQDGRSV